MRCSSIHSFASCCRSGHVNLWIMVSSWRPLYYHIFIFMKLKGLVWWLTTCDLFLEIKDQHLILILILLSSGTNNQEWLTMRQLMKSPLVIAMIIVNSLITLSAIVLGVCYCVNKTRYVLSKMIKGYLIFLHTLYCIKCMFVTPSLFPL